MPLPDRGERFTAARVEEMGDPVRRGRQAKLCMTTMCCVCYVAQLRIAARRASLGLLKRGELARDEDRLWIVDWSRLPEGDAFKSHPHHEPEGVDGDDDDTLPLCYPHHTGSGNARHPDGPVRFWAFWRIRWESVRDEMRARTKLARESG